MEDNKIILDFRETDYSDAAVRKDSELVNKVQMEKMMELVGNQVENSKKFKLPEGNKSEKQHHVHNTISIFGNRGAGKTTFLQTALYQISQKYEEEAVLLKVLDPSLLDCKQHPFISIIASIHELVEECISKDYLNRGNISKTDKDKYDFSFKSLLKGLPFIDGVGSANSYQDWDDDLYVSMQGMEKAEASNNLIDNFIEYVYNALKVLNKKCFIIPFDDIDTNINKGFEILEVIRKYLITEQIITILTGDLDLYSKLVRKASWESFSKDFLEKECNYSKRNPDEFSHMINHLENQYLLKVLKPEYRIHLKTIREVIESKEYNILVDFNKANTPFTINECYTFILDRIGFEINNIRVTNQIIYFLESLSIRTQMRLLKLLSSYYEQSFDKNTFIHEFINIFWTDIKQKSLDAKSLVNDDSYYPVEMMKFLIDTKSLSNCSDFMPHTNDDILNKALLAISAQFTKQTQNSSFMIFDYWVRVCYIKYVVESLKTEDSTNMLDEIVKFSSILEHDDLTKCIGLVEAYSRSIYKSQSSYNKTLSGTIIIKDKVSNINNPYTAFLDIISHGTIDQSNHYIRYVSIYKLFAILRDFLFHSIENQNSHVLKDEYSDLFLLRKISQFRGYLEPTFTKDKYEIKINNDEFDSIVWNQRMMTSQWYDLSRKLIDWSKKYSSNNMNIIYPQLLNRIFTRTFFTLINIDNSSSYVNLGQKFNAYIIAFLNSVLVECSFDFMMDKKLNRELIIDNTKKIEYVFKNNLYNLRNLNDFSFLYWLIDCPLLKLFIDPVFYNLIKSSDKPESIRIELDKNYIEREQTYRLLSLHSKLNEYNELSEKLLKAIRWSENFQMKTNLDNKNNLKRLIFSLEPVENDIMFLDISMPNNMIFSKIDKLSIMLEKVGLAINDLTKQIELVEMFLGNNKVVMAKEQQMKDDEKNKDFYYRFFDFLCEIKLNNR